MGKHQRFGGLMVQVTLPRIAIEPSAVNRTRAWRCLVQEGYKRLAKLAASLAGGQPVYRFKVHFSGDGNAPDGAQLDAQVQGNGVQRTGERRVSPREVVCPVQLSVLEFRVGLSNRAESLMKVVLHGESGVP